MRHHVHDPIGLPPEKRSVARSISDRLGDDGQGALLLPNGEQFELPKEAGLLLRELFAALADGQAVSVVPLQKELTTQEAADLLNMSRQGLVDLLEAGKLPFHKPNKHRRIRAADLLRYKQQRDEERARALRELTQLSEEIGDYYGEG